MTYLADGLPPRFSCPDDMTRHCAEVFAGVYDVPSLSFAKPPRINDCGANVGSFAVWASQRWPGATVHCYEPNPSAFAWLKENIRHCVHDVRGWGLFKHGVRLTTGSGRLYLGRHNLGEASVHYGAEQMSTFVGVDFVAASELPDADIVKVDTEGCEVEIIDGYLESREHRPAVFLLEFHSEKDRRSLDVIFDDFGYALVKARIDRPDRGVCCYVKREVLRHV